MDIFKRHGLTLSLGALLGYLVLMILSFVGLGILAALIGGSIFTIASNPEDPTALLSILGSGMAFLIIPLYLFLILFNNGYLLAGLTGSVNDAVFRNQSSVGSFINYGFKNLWKTIKLLLLLFVCIIPVYLVLLVLSFIPVIGILLDIIIVIFIFIPASAAFTHSFILCHERNLGAWESLKAGFLTFTRAYGKTFVSALLAFVSVLAIAVVFGLLLGLVMGVGFSSDLSGTAIAIILLLSLVFVPAMYIVGQLVITIRFKDKIAPLVFTNFQATTPPVQQQNPNQFDWE